MTTIIAQDPTLDLERGVLTDATPPCLSLYQPTSRHHPENRQDPIRFGNLVTELERSLASEHPPDRVASLLAPFRALAEDAAFWEHAADGLAVLGSSDGIRVYRLQRPVPSLAIVADSFHLKPLRRILQSADRFQVLALDRGGIALYEGNRDTLDEIPLAEQVPRTMTEALGTELTEPHLTVASYGSVRGAHAPGMRRDVQGAHSATHHGHGGGSEDEASDTERFFRAVDRAVLKQHLQHTQLPLLLAGLPEHLEVYRRISQNPHLLGDGIPAHPAALDSLEELRERAWTAVAPRYEARLAALADKFGSARAQNRGASEVEAVARAAAEGRVESVMLEAERQIPGRVDAKTGKVTSGQLENPTVDDVLDDIGELVAARGGEVVVVPADRMPTTTGVAAVYRFAV